MKYQKVMYQFLKQCRQFDFLYFVDIVNASKENIIVNTLEPNVYSCYLNDPLEHEVAEVVIRLNSKKEIVYAQCSCEQDEELFDDSKYCPHIIGTYLLILEHFNEDFDIIQFILDQLDSIEWKEVAEDTFRNHMPNNDMFSSIMNDHEYDDISVYDLFEGMTRDQILEFLDNISYAFPPLKTMLVQATMLAEMIGGEEEDEFDEINKMLTKKKGMLS